MIVPKGTDARANVSLVEADTLRKAVSAGLAKADPAAA